jgi:hypothetical protein
MAVYNKFNSWVEVMSESANVGSDQFVVALTNVAPVAGNTVLADITQISYANLSSRNLTTTSATQTGGTYSLTFADLTLTASGAVPTFRYVVIYDDTVTSPADPLVCWYDYGVGGVTLATSGDSLLIDFAGPQLYTVT